jgi:arylsulfatase B
MFVSLLLAAASGSEPAPNFLVIIADDLGVDRVAAYAEHPDPGRTRNIDRLARNGVLFRNAYANPVCTPSRATLMTGRYGFRTGVGRNAGFDGVGHTLDPSELLLEESLAGYASGFFGKWHLVAGEVEDHPIVTGVADYRGSLHNLSHGLPDNPNYFHWKLSDNGQVSSVDEYATSWTTDRAIEALNGLPEPHIVWVSYNAPHAPFHEPPAQLHDYDLAGLQPGLNKPLFGRAMAQAMDTEIGRLLRAIDNNTFVIFMGDNGTAKGATDAPFEPEHAKTTVYEGGINVPLIVFGPGVARNAECDALVNSTDLFATVLELAGFNSSAEDSVSLVPYLQDPTRPSLRDWVYSEYFHPDFNRQAIRNERYKLIRRFDTATGVTTEELFDLLADPWETSDLLAAGLDSRALEAYSELWSALP